MVAELKWQNPYSCKEKSLQENNWYFSKMFFVWKSFSLKHFIPIPRIVYCTGSRSNPHCIFKTASHISYIIAWLASYAKHVIQYIFPDTFEKAEKEREKWEEGRRSSSQQARSGTHHRSRRSVSRERQVETLVVVDKRMMEYYKDDNVETYVLTIMNMVGVLEKLLSHPVRGCIKKW